MRLPVPAQGWRGALRASTISLACLLAALVLESDLAVRVLVACEFSGVVAAAFREKGHGAISRDLLPSEDEGRFHLQCDVLSVLDKGWDLMIAHPPCTFLCNSGVKHLYIGGRKENGLDRLRWANMVNAAIFFKALLNAPIPRIAIENPIPHGWALERIGKDYDDTFQPWQFWAGEPGKGEVKRTCIWRKNLPALVPTTPNETGRIDRIHKMGPSKTRGHDRSVTYPGWAQAAAEQWGKFKGVADEIEFAQRAYQSAHP